MRGSCCLRVSKTVQMRGGLERYHLPSLDPTTNESKVRGSSVVNARPARALEPRDMKILDKIQDLRYLYTLGYHTHIRPIPRQECDCSWSPLHYELHFLWIWEAWVHRLPFRRLLTILLMTPSCVLFCSSLYSLFRLCRFCCVCVCVWPVWSGCGCFNDPPKKN